MSKINRRKFIKLSAGAGLAATAWSSLLQQALAVKAHNATRSIRDVEHIVILMQENRSFDHYFGTMKGVRGFGDRFPMTWPTIPDVLEKAGISWRIYQDPNDNWTGAMHGCLAFESFRTAKPGSSIYENGMRHWSLQDLANDVKNNKLPQVTWVLPPKSDSEHPGAPSSPYRGSYFVHEVLSAITANPEVWSKTVFFLTFDENDGLFDHLPAPAVPSYNLDNTLAGKSTLDLNGMYFHNDKDSFDFSRDTGGDPRKKRKYHDKRDKISGPIRPWGLGPRVPLYIISPWSKGGWVDSHVADHTSVGQFIEKRFGVTIPAISPWHRAISSDLVSAFDFLTPNDPVFPVMPDTANYASLEAASGQLPLATAPPTPSPLYQEKGIRFSRALPYRLKVHLQKLNNENKISLVFENNGKSGVVYHVYDLKHLDRIPRRYTVEAGKSLADDWNVGSDEGLYDLEVYGPNGYFQKFSGNLTHLEEPEIGLDYNHRKGGISVSIHNAGESPIDVTVSSNAYDYGGPWSVSIAPGERKKKNWLLKSSGNWYDFSVKAGDLYLRRFAGRVETGKPGISDPAMATEI